jgi:hypothetical protein
MPGAANAEQKMTNRTASLVMMFIMALGASAVLMAILLWLLDGANAGGPWLLPVLAAGCQAAVLFLGRHHILSPGATASASRAAVTILIMVASTLAVAVAVVGGVRWLLGSVKGAPVVLFAVWFALLWMMVQRQARWPRTVR